MARIAGVDLPRNKRIEIGLTYIYGIGLSSSQTILTKANVNASIRCKDLTDQDISVIREIIDQEYQVEGAARRMTGGSSRSTLSAQSVETNRVEVDRWALLAGIKK